MRNSIISRMYENSQETRARPDFLPLKRQFVCNEPDSGNKAQVKALATDVRVEDANDLREYCLAQLQSALDTEITHQEPPNECYHSLLVRLGIILGLDGLRHSAGRQLALFSSTGRVLRVAQDLLKFRINGP